jgi:EpsI family protein
MNRQGHSWWRTSAVAFLLLSTLILLTIRSHAEYVPDHKRLSDFPLSLAGWQGTDVALAPDVLETLGPGEFLFRDYVDPPHDDYLNLYIAYFPSQRAGDTVHSPKNCLPGAGWQAAEAGYVSIDRSGRSPIKINRYLVEKGRDRALVLYWYQAHGRVIPSEYSAKFYLVYDAIRMNRSDGALVRIVTNVSRNEKVGEADNRALTFARRTLPLLDEFIPR